MQTSKASALAKNGKRRCYGCGRWVPPAEVWWVLPPEIGVVVQPKPYCPECEESLEES